MNMLDEVRSRVSRLSRDINLPSFPAAVIRAEAAKRWSEALRKGSIFFYDKQKVRIGLRNIDWSGGHINHQEWRAQLNRFFWLGYLVTHYRRTRAPDLPGLAQRTIEDWIDAHEPYGADKSLAPSDNTLNLSIRLGQPDYCGWWHAAAAFSRTPAFDEAFVQRMLESTRGQIESLVARLASDMNWRISHLNCILFCSLALPGFERYRDFAVIRLNEAFRRQVDKDGSHTEHCPSSYHLWMTRVFLRLHDLARARPELGLCMPSERVGRMWDYGIYAATPDGGSGGLHDGPVWTPDRPLRALPADRRRFLRRAGLRGQEWTLAGRTDRFFPDAGQCFLRDSWRDDATHVSIDATMFGGGHSHLSRLAVNLYSGKRMLLYDPGIFTYEPSSPFLPYGKSTRAHNTITIRSYSQVETDPVVSDVCLLPKYSLFNAAYAGAYVSADCFWGFRAGHGNVEYGAHERTVFWAKGAYLLVFDVVKADLAKAMPYQAHWQFPIGPAFLDARRQAAWTGGAQDNVLVQLLHSSGAVASSLRKGESEPVLGWLPIGQQPEWKPAPHLLMEGTVQGGYATQVTLLMPFKGVKPPVIRARQIPDAPQGVHALELEAPGGITDVVVATPNLWRMIGECGPVSTDASLVWIRRKNNRVLRAFLHDGVFLNYNGKTLLKKSQAGSFGF